MSLEIFIVSYRRADLLERCLDSVEQWFPDADVHIWDNHSDGSPEVRRLAERRPAHRWTFSPANLGFAAAVNELTADVTQPRFLLLNPDAELLCALPKTQALLDEHPSVAAAAPRILDPAESESWDNARRPPTALRMVVGNSGYAGRLRGRPASDHYGSFPVGPVGYLSGACLLIRTAAWTSVGAFDPQFFVYSEEMDWATRAAKNSWQLRLADEVGVRHAPGGTMAENDGGRSKAVASRLTGELLHRTQVQYLAKHHGRVATLAFKVGNTSLAHVQRSKRRDMSGTDA